MANAGDRKFREIFFAFNGSGPYKCYFCNEEVDFWTVMIHHENHDHYDNRLENLVPAHRGCHTKHHSIGRTTGRKASEETKEKMRQAQKARWAAMSEEERSTIGQKSADTRAPNQADLSKKSWETRKKVADGG